jgi:ABC-type transporter Mla subunit MlaD
VINADQKVYTIIETKEKLTFYNDYTVSVIPKGIMGDRYLEIEPGTAASVFCHPQTHSWVLL